MSIKKTTKCLILLSSLLLLRPSVSHGQGPAISTIFEFEESDVIKSDLDFLSTLTELQEENHEAKFVFGVEQFNPQSLRVWLRERISYLIPKEREGHVSILKVPEDLEIPYPNPNISPIPTESLYTLMDQFQTIQMENIGAGIYLYGKRKKSLLRLDLSHHFPERKVENLKVLSPRIGLIEINKNILYRESHASFSKEKVLDLYPSSRILRLSHLFHEGRHSDGQGNSLGFFHSRCPSGSDYAGLEACDEVNNGAYTIGALFIKAAHQACISCTENDKELLKLIYLDSKSRVSNIKSLPSVEIEKINALTNKLNLTYMEYYSDFGALTDKNLTVLTSKIDKLKKEIEKLQNPPSRPKRYWDPTPEFLMLK